MSSPLTAKGIENIKEWQKWLVDSGLAPFSQVYIAKGGEEVFYNDYGYQDLESKTPITRKSVSRIFSMTKPISSLALMLLFDKGMFQLSDPVHLYLGDKWKKSRMKVYDHSSEQKVACRKSITIKHLLTHTSGISYAFDMFGTKNEVDKSYYDEQLLVASKDKEIKSSVHHYSTLADFVDKLAEMPLMFQPGDHFNYGYNVEVVGRLIEVLSGVEYSKFVFDNILQPLDMKHTGFFFRDKDFDKQKLTSLYRHQLNPLGRGLKREDLKLKKVYPDKSRQWTKEQTFFKPGEGLVSTIDDYAKFAKMVRNGGTLNGKRIISRKTLEFMGSNHLRTPDNKPTTMALMQHPNAFEDIVHGRGFGLGFCIDLDPPGHGINCSPGTIYWSGAASTHFWVDPAEDLVVVFFSQLFFPEVKLLPLRHMLVNVVYGSLGEGQLSAQRLLQNSQLSRL